MKRKAPKNIKMTELSKIASESWKKLSEKEKVEWKRLYEINRDLPQNSLNTSNPRNAPNSLNTPNTTDKKDLVETATTDNDPFIKFEVVETVDQLSDGSKKNFYEIHRDFPSNTQNTPNKADITTTDNDPPIKMEPVEY